MIQSLINRAVYYALLIILLTLSVVPALAQRNAKNSRVKAKITAKNKVKKIAQVRARPKRVQNLYAPKTAEDYARAGFKVALPTTTVPQLSAREQLPGFRFQITCSENKFVLIRVYDIEEPKLPQYREFTTTSLSTTEYSTLLKEDIPSLIATAFIKELKVKLVSYETFFTFNREGLDINLSRIAIVLQQYLPDYNVQEITVMGRVGCSQPFVAKNT